MMALATRGGIVAVCMMAAALAAGCGYSAPPEQQATDFVAAVQPGMTWEQVIAVKAPRRWAVGSSEAMGGHGQLMQWTEEQTRDGLAKDGFPEGFLFQYRFTENHAYQVWFDEEGKVSSVERMRSMNDLLSQ